MIPILHFMCRYGLNSLVDDRILVACSPDVSSVDLWVRHPVEYSRTYPGRGWSFRAMIGITGWLRVLIS